MPHRAGQPMRAHVQRRSGKCGADDKQCSLASANKRRGSWLAFSTMMTIWCVTLLRQGFAGAEYDETECVRCMKVACLSAKAVPQDYEALVGHLDAMDAGRPSLPTLQAGDAQHVRQEHQGGVCRGAEARSGVMCGTDVIAGVDTAVATSAAGAAHWGENAHAALPRRGGAAGECVTGALEACHWQHSQPGCHQPGQSGEARPGLAGASNPHPAQAGINSHHRQPLYQIESPFEVTSEPEDAYGTDLNGFSQHALHERQLAARKCPAASKFAETTGHEPQGMQQQQQPQSQHGALEPQQGLPDGAPERGYVSDDDDQVLIDVLTTSGGIQMHKCGPPCVLGINDTDNWKRALR